MTNWMRLKKENEKITECIINEADEWQYEMQKTAEEAKRVAEIAKYSDILIDEIDKNFEKATKLKGIDIRFLFLAIALQCVRQYIIGTVTQRLDDQSAAKNVKDGIEEKSNRKHRYYNPSLDEIITNPVPFDANIGANGALRGGGKMGHRVTAIGHDPILGLIFGTSNIATSTLTTSNFRSYHIYSGEIVRNGRIEIRDVFEANAITSKVLSKTKDKIFDEGMEGKIKVSSSLIKEIIHLKSDMYSKNSLPLPFLSVIDSKLASNIAEYGFDMGNVIKVGKQAEYAILINALIGMLHGLCFDEKVDGNYNIYSVRTRKILSYSNMIATSSNVVAVAVASIIGIVSENPELVKKSVNYLDIGGIMVMIYRLISDQNFICEVKKEFLSQEWDAIIMGN